MKRERTCRWCEHYKVSTESCTYFPEWVCITRPESHYCGQHSWNKAALDVIADQVYQEMN